MLEKNVFLIRGLKVHLYKKIIVINAQVNIYNIMIFLLLETCEALHPEYG